MNKEDVYPYRTLDVVGCHDWKPVFAWRPCTTVSGKTVWFKKIYKRVCFQASNERIGQNFKMEYKIEYGTLFDILKDNG